MSISVGIQGEKKRRELAWKQAPVALCVCWLVGRLVCVFVCVAPSLLRTPVPTPSRMYGRIHIHQQGSRRGGGQHRSLFCFSCRLISSCKGNTASSIASMFQKDKIDFQNLTKQRCHRKYGLHEKGGFQADKLVNERTQKKEITLLLC